MSERLAPHFSTVSRAPNASTGAQDVLHADLHRHVRRRHLHRTPASASACAWRRRKEVDEVFERNRHALSSSPCFAGMRPEIYDSRCWGAESGEKCESNGASGFCLHDCFATRLSCITDGRNENQDYMCVDSFGICKEEGDPCTTAAGSTGRCKEISPGKPECFAECSTIGDSCPDGTCYYSGTPKSYFCATTGTKPPETCAGHYLTVSRAPNASTGAAGCPACRSAPTRATSHPAPTPASASAYAWRRRKGHSPPGLATSSRSWLQLPRP